MIIFIFNDELRYKTVLSCINSIPAKAPDEDKKAKCLLVLTTIGGSIGASYKLITSLKNKYEVVSSCVIQHCKSAGTFIVLGADNLIMSETGELGPLDVQVYKRDSIILPNSGLDSFATIKEISKKIFDLTMDCFVKLARGDIATKLALDSSINIAAKSIELAISKSSPYDIGMHARAISIVKKYVDNINTDNLEADTLEKLIYGYPDHGFVIDIKQAKELFKNVVLLNDESIIKSLSLLNSHWKTYYVPCDIITKISKNEKEDNANEQQTNNKQKNN